MGLRRKRGIGKKITLDYIRWIFRFEILYSTIYNYKGVGNGEIRGMKNKVRFKSEEI